MIDNTKTIMDSIMITSPNTTTRRVEASRAHDFVGLISI